MALTLTTLMLALTASAACATTHLLPQPASVVEGEGSYRVPSKIVLRTSEQGHPVAWTAIRLAAPYQLQTRINIEAQPGKGWQLASRGVTAPPAPEGPESYRLSVTDKGIALSASSEVGFRYGVLTLVQLLAHGDTLPTMEIDDRPALALRALMIDMVRCKEKDEVYFSMLEEMAAWKMNALFLHFSDQNGCTLELKSHPELVSAHAMSQETVKRLIERGRELGVRVIPEVEAWGHAGWITAAHPELGEGGDGFSLCPSNEAVYTLLDDVIKEVAALFPDPYLHIGCDEASWGKDDACKARAAAVGEDRLIADHINRVNKIVRKYGKTSVAWGDIILRQNTILDHLDKDIVAENWDYNETVKPDKLRRAREKGFKAIAGPALMWNGYRICAARDNFTNTARFAGHAYSEHAEGVATTIWVTQRIIPSSLGPGIAWAAECSWNANLRDGPRTPEDVMAAYALHRFGMEPTPERAQRFARLADVGHTMDEMSPALWWKLDKLLWLNSWEAQADNADYAKRVAGLGRPFEKDRANVRLNRGDYDSLALAAALGDHLANRRIAASETVRFIHAAQADMTKGDIKHARYALKSAADAIRKMEFERAHVFDRMQELWDRDRYADDPMRNGVGGGHHNLMWWIGSRDVYGYAEDMATRLEEQAKKPDAGVIAGLLSPTK